MHHFCQVGPTFVDFKYFGILQLGQEIHCHLGPQTTRRTTPVLIVVKGNQKESKNSFRIMKKQTKNKEYPRVTIAKSSVFS